MCATVPTMPIVLMVPLTDLSAAMVMVPVPVAVVVTGGVSSAPINFTFTSAALDAPQNAMRPAAATSARTRTLLNGLLTVSSLPHEMVGHAHYRAKFESPPKEKASPGPGSTLKHPAISERHRQVVTAPPAAPHEPPLSPSPPHYDARRRNRPPHRPRHGGPLHVPRHRPPRHLSGSLSHYSDEEGTPSVRQRPN